MTTAPYSSAAGHGDLAAKAAPAPALTRDWQIDAAKALAIVLVVLG
ncbi:MAG: polysaccharide biosynthesis protein GumF, partial [Oxalobacteraceae bacterium]